MIGNPPKFMQVQYNLHGNISIQCLFNSTYYFNKTLQNNNLYHRSITIQLSLQVSKIKLRQCSHKKCFKDIVTTHRKRKTILNILYLESITSLHFECLIIATLILSMRPPWKAAQIAIVNTDSTHN